MLISSDEWTVGAAQHTYHTTPDSCTYWLHNGDTQLTSHPA